ncbi:hypothetical protein ACHQM5_015171 [Ranunculus cassubicifolius]
MEMMLKELIGYHFQPTDEQLVDHYLHNKVTGTAAPWAHCIQEVDVYGSEEPWKIFESHGLSKHDDDFHFFSRIKNKFGNGNISRKDRQAGQGSWMQQRSKQFNTTTMKAIMTTLNFYNKDKDTGFIDKIKGRTKWIMLGKPEVC